MTCRIAAIDSDLAFAPLMVSPRKPTIGFWITVALVGLPVLYVASFGPACRIESRSDAKHGNLLSASYLPIVNWLADSQSNASLKKAAMWYVQFGIPERKYVELKSQNGRLLIPGIPSRSTH